MAWRKVSPRCNVSMPFPSLLKIIINHKLNSLYINQFCARCYDRLGSTSILRFYGNFRKGACGSTLGQFLIKWKMTYMPLMKKKVPTSTFSVFFFSSSFYVFPNLEFVAQCRVQSKLIFLFYLNFHALYLIKLSSKLTCISYQNSWLCIFLCEDVRICRAQFHEKNGWIWKVLREYLPRKII